MRNAWLQIGQKHMTTELLKSLVKRERTCVESKLQKKPEDNGNKSSGN